MELSYDVAPSRPGRMCLSSNQCTARTKQVVHMLGEMPVSNISLMRLTPRGCGQDISGACGQLVIEHGGSGCSKDGRATDIEELARRPAATPVA